MQRRNRRTRCLSPKAGLRHTILYPKQDLWLHARSFHTAAKKLAETFKLDPDPLTEFAACPVVFMYRHALELYLKAIVLGGGGNFLATQPDPLSVHKTHSVSWLAQFVAQIVKTLKWEAEFKCEGIENLDDFKAVVESVNSVDPGSYVFRPPNVAVSEFARKMEDLLDLLDSTGDALAAEWDLRSGGAAVDDEGQGGDFGPTIQ